MQEYYYLYLITPGVNFENYWSNKHLVNCGLLSDLDEFTSVYQNAQDLGEDINLTNQQVNFISAILISEKVIKKIRQNNNTPSTIKYELPLFLEDRNFVIRETKDINSKYQYDRELIYQYQNYLMNHKDKISSSLVRAVRLGIEIGPSIHQQDMEKVFFSYYQKPSYKKMRNTYLELKKFDVIKPTITSEFSSTLKRK